MTLPLDPARRRAPDARPQQILDAALLVFGEQGLAGARLDDIARRAGIAKGTIYLYFANKEELFREVVRQTLGTRLDELAEEFGRPARGTGAHTCADQLRAYMRTWWDALKEPAFRTIYRLVVGELHQFPDLMQFYLAEVVSRKVALHAGVIARGVAAGEFHATDPRVAARMISSMFVTHALWVARPLPPLAIVGDMSDDAVYAQLEDFALRALRPDAASTSA